MLFSRFYKSSFVFPIVGIAASLFFGGCAPALPSLKPYEVNMPDSFSSISTIPSPSVMRDDSSSMTKAFNPQIITEFFKDTLLVNLIDSVILRNPDLAMASQKIKTAQSEVILTRGWLRPKVDANVAGALRRYGLYTMDGAGNSSTYILPGKIVPTNLPDYLVGFQSSWEIDVWGKLNHRKKSALSKFISSQEARKWLITQLVKKTAQGYYNLQACDLELKCIEESILLQNRAYEIVKAKKEATLLNELAVKQFEAQLLELKSLKEEVKNRIIDNEKELNDLLGRFYQPIKRDTSFYSKEVLTPLKQGLPIDLLKNRSDVQQSYWQLQSSINEVSAARKAFYPSLIMTSSVGFQGFRPDLLFLTPQALAYTLVGNSLLPVVNRSALRSQFMFHSANNVDAAINYSKTVLLSYNEVETEWKKLENYSQIFLLKQDETKTLSQSVNIAEELFRNGRATYLEVLFAQQNTLKTKVEMILSRKHQLYTYVNLYAAFGGGWRMN